MPEGTPAMVARAQKGLSLHWFQILGCAAGKLHCILHSLCTCLPCQVSCGSHQLDMQGLHQELLRPQRLPLQFKLKIAVLPAYSTVTAQQHPSLRS